MAKLVKLEQKTFEGKPSGFKITLDDGRTGNLQEKESDKGLREGDNVTVTEIPYTSKAGKTSTLYGLRLNTTPASGPQNAPTPAPASSKTPSATPLSVNPVKANATIEAMRFCIDAFIADKITWDKIKDYHKEITGYLNDAIDECSQ